CLGLAIATDALARSPGEVIAGCVVIAAVGGVRLFRRTAIYRFGIGVSLLDLLTPLILVVGGLAWLFSPSGLTRCLSLGFHLSWHDIALAIPLAMLACTGLETV